MGMEETVTHRQSMLQGSQLQDLLLVPQPWQ